MITGIESFIGVYSILIISQNISIRRMHNRIRQLMSLGDDIHDRRKGMKGRYERSATIHDFRSLNISDRRSGPFRSFADLPIRSFDQRTVSCLVCMFERV